MTPLLAGLAIAGLTATGAIAMAFREDRVAWITTAVLAGVIAGGVLLLTALR